MVFGIRGMESITNIYSMEIYWVVWLVSEPIIYCSHPKIDRHVGNYWTPGKLEKSMVHGLLDRLD